MILDAYIFILLLKKKCEDAEQHRMTKLRLHVYHDFAIKEAAKVDRQ